MSDVKPRLERIAVSASRSLAACFLGLCLTVAGVQAYGQEPALPPAGDTEAKSADHTLSLSGTVVNAMTGEPIHRAAVTIFSGQNSFSTLSDNSGHFEFNGLPEGLAFVSAARPGFGNQAGLA